MVNVSLGNDSVIIHIITSISTYHCRISPPERSDQDTELESPTVAK